ncbi:MAG: 30S ribosomal protein S1, partial [Candidatus Cloacimonetes bacterium]|nr:30S ribosomal protein S1 [Candidatus Cloacimonadota bacterium]
MMFNDRNEKVESDPIEVKEEVKVEEVKKEVKKEAKKQPTKKVQKTKKVAVKKTTTKTKEETMATLLSEHDSKFKKGNIIKGTVVDVNERNIYVDIGYKSASPIAVKEFNTNNIPKKDDIINVFIDSLEDDSGKLRLSKKKADFYLHIEELEQKQAAGETVKGIYKRRIKGGMIVDILSIEAFLPGSQISLKPIPNLDQFIGKEHDFKVINLDKEKRNIVISRRDVLVREREERIKSLRDKIVEGSEHDGEVRNITDYGAFVDLGGIDGLLHITDMSWGHIKHPSDMLNIGDKIKVKILKYNEESLRVSLGLKQLVPHPWQNIEAKYPEGTIVDGKVVNLTNYGAFIELEAGVEGLVHVSELSWTKKVNHPKQILKVGETVKAIVLNISKEDERISLGIKQMEPNPWLMVDQKYPVDTEIEGVVKTLTPFGVFIGIEDNIEGLIHISDISWTKRIYHPKEVLKVGETIKVKVLSIDKTLHRIALGIKQLNEDPWNNLDKKLPINAELKAKIVKVISKGVLVDIEVDDYTVEGFIPLSHLAIPDLKRSGDAFKLNEELPLKIIELDLENRRLILSVKAYFFAREKNELQDYVDAHLAIVQEKHQKKTAKKEKKVKEEVVEVKEEVVEVKEEVVEVKEEVVEVKEEVVEVKEEVVEV